MNENEIAKFKGEFSLYLGEKGIALSNGKEHFHFTKNKLDNLNLKADIITNDSKELLSVNSNIKNYFDISIAHNLVHPQAEHNLDSIIKEILGVEIEEKSKKADIQRAYYMFLIKKYLAERITKNELDENYRLELELVSIIINMEKNGIKVEKSALENYGKEIDKKLDEISKKIYSLAKQEFNILSIKQLSKVLYEDMRITPIKRTKTEYSTDSDVLAIFEKQGIEIASHVLEYRKLAKIKNTFIDGVIQRLDKDEEVHVYFNLLNESGRLTTSNPNLQSLPVNKEEGKKIKESYISHEGNKFLIFDYPEMEIRILAFLSQDKGLMNICENSKGNLYALIAEKIFNKKSLNEEEKRKAESIIFNFIYPQSMLELSRELKISFKETKELTESFLKAFPEVKNFFASNIDKARNQSYIQNIFGRKNYFPLINGSNILLRKGAERAIIAFLLQSTQADILKRALVEIDKNIKEAKIVIQVHGEILIEVEENKEKEYLNKIAKIMEKCGSFEKHKLKVEKRSNNIWA